MGPEDEPRAKRRKGEGCVHEGGEVEEEDGRRSTEATADAIVRIAHGLHTSPEVVGAAVWNAYRLETRGLPCVEHIPSAAVEDATAAALIKLASFALSAQVDLSRLASVAFEDIEAMDGNDEDAVDDAVNTMEAAVLSALCWQVSVDSVERRLRATALPPAAHTLALAYARDGGWRLLRRHPPREVAEGLAVLAMETLGAPRRDGGDVAAGVVAEYRALPA